MGVDDALCPGDCRRARLPLQGDVEIIPTLGRKELVLARLIGRVASVPSSAAVARRTKELQESGCVRVATDYVEIVVARGLVD